MESSSQTEARSAEYYLIAKNEMENFMERCILAAGASESHAKNLANCLITADHRGHFSHGLNRLEVYVRDLKAGIANSSGEPVTEKESPATALVNGNNLLGPVVGNYCMKLAIEKAKNVGIGMVVCRRSNHYGIAGYYSMQALEHKMIGMSFTNASPIVFPTRSKTRTFGTNPISFAAPGQNGDSFVLDMATSTVAYGKVEMCDRKGLSIPSAWGADADGKPTTNPKDITTGGLFPLGGSEETGGYKGYGLVLMVEILCGIITGAKYGPNVRIWQTCAEEADLGQCFIAINPEFFGDNFEERLQDLMDICRGLEPINPNKPVLIPGDPERANMRKSDENGIAYHVNQIKYVEKLANELNVPVPESKPAPMNH